MTEQTLEQKIDAITTWISETDSFNSSNNMDKWVAGSWHFAVAEYTDNGTKSALTTTISQISRAAKKFNIQDYPLNTRGTSNLSDESVAIISAHDPFLNLMGDAFDVAPEIFRVNSKKSIARPDRKYLSREDWVKHWLDHITDNEKAAVKSVATEATQ